MTLLVVCQWRIDADLDTGSEVELQGVFDNPEAALAACVGKYYFIWQAVKLNTCLPDERLLAKGWYPNLSEPPPEWWVKLCNIKNGVTV